jgi:hypothetical protein
VKKSKYMILGSSLLSRPTTQTQELWIGYTSISRDNSQVGQFRIGGLFCSIRLNNGEQNWFFTNLPTPNVSDGWKIKSVKLRIRTEESPFGGIDKVGIRDGEGVIHEFNPLAITSFNNWQTISREVPGGPRSFRFGLGLSIHLNNRVDTKEDPPPPLPPVKISVASVGAEFIKSSLTGTVFDSRVLDAARP